MEYEIKLLPHQKSLYKSTKNIAGLVCGRGSRQNSNSFLDYRLSFITGKKNTCVFSNIQVAIPKSV